MSPPGCFGIILISTCHDFRNREYFYECCDKCFVVLMKEACKNINEGHLTGLYCGILCTSACRCIFVCIIVWDCRRNLMICGRLFVSCVIIYVKTWLICDHLLIPIGKKRFEERAVFLHLIDVGLCSQ